MQLIEIEKILLNGEKNIKLIKLQQFMKSSNIEVRGAVAELITNPRIYKLVNPKLDFQDYYLFLFNYYIDCMQNNYDGDWSHSPYLAAYALKDLIISIWDDNQRTKEQRINLHKDIKKRLEKLSLEADQSFKITLINGLFEHLFEDTKILKYFSDWKNKDILNQYYECSIDKLKDI